jgi:hypothetical protein
MKSFSQLPDRIKKVLWRADAPKKKNRAGAVRASRVNFIRELRQGPRRPFAHIKARPAARGRIGFGLCPAALSGGKAQGFGLYNFGMQVYSLA